MSSAAGETRAFFDARHPTSLQQAGQALETARSVLVQRRRARDDARAVGAPEESRSASIERQEAILELAGAAFELARRLPPEAARADAQQVLEALAAYELRATALRSAVTEQRGIEFAQNEQAIRRALQVTARAEVGLVALLVFLIDIALVFARRSILQPIDELVSMASRASGDGRALDATRADGIGRIQAAFNETFNDLCRQREALAEREAVLELANAESRLARERLTLMLEASGFSLWEWNRDDDAIRFDCRWTPTCWRATRIR